MATRRKMLDPIPPGEILMEEFMRPLGLSINALARALARASEPHRWHRQWQARDLGRHRAATGQGLRHVGRDSARPAIGLRASRRAADDVEGRGTDGADPSRVRVESSQLLRNRPLEELAGSRD